MQGPLLQASAPEVEMAAPAASQPVLSAEMLLEQLKRLQLKNQSLESERQLLKSAISGSTCQPALDAVKFQATMDSGSEADKWAMQQRTRRLQLYLTCLAQLDPENKDNQEYWGRAYSSRAVGKFQVRTC
jgi:hypothetical protein